ncbi:hypothetical protein Agabi119p4_1399 [Agaricus bisporus var. burnettii]|uniref:F-box domain-containing protein n=1 Tax=Agaricus bisporus var. burnettii TaxID=192524 RepID=A0A8H7KKG5_AGABI|nr:hypothetical protein Agabi119p4_1399 [Agaricus bisporus var. burnettii]
MDEISFVTATVARLDCEIERLNDHRASLLRRLNHIQPTTRTLPPETLALIFHHALHARQTTPLLLGAVCSHWHAVAWSTPLLWTTIDPLPIRRNAQPSDAALLRLYFRNARALPVSLHIKLDRLSSSPSAASEDILRAVFSENSVSIGALVCTSKSSLRQRWAMLAPKLARSPFPNLKRLEINLRGAPLSRFDTPMFTYAPRLSTVLFSGYHLPHDHFCDQITVLDLSSLPVSQCLESLVRCPNLVDFRCTSPRPSHKPVDSVMSKHRPPYTFPHLQKFEWIGSLSDWDIFLYTYINLPHLQHLILGHSHPLSRPLDPTLPPSTPNIQTTDPGLWKSFFKRMKSLHTLELTVFHSAEEWLEVFDILSSTLSTVTFTAYRDADEIVHLLRALTLSYPTTTTPNKKNYLPNVKSLSATLDLHPDKSNFVLDMLCSRRIRPIMVHNDVTLDSASDVSSTSTSSNDYLVHTSVDVEYWSTHTRLQEATIKCWPFGFDFGEREREVARLLKEGGLLLDVFGQARRVDWL